MDIFCVSLQMELHAKFLCVSSIRTCKIKDLSINTQYPILGAERAMTHLGRTVILTLLEGTDTIVKVFLPKRYARVVSNADIAHINMNPFSLSALSRDRQSVEIFVANRSCIIIVVLITLFALSRYIYVYMKEINS